MGDLGDFLRGMGEFIFACIAVYNLIVSRKHANDIAELTNNTNSIKDALVKVTGEAERAKGVLEGRAERDQT
jgi:hypothetical protein